jgi:hypothetical protein
VVSVHFLEAQIAELHAAVSNGYEGERCRVSERTTEMSDVTYYVALPWPAIRAAPEGERVLQPEVGGDEGRSASHKRGHVGALAFSRTGDPSTGDFGNAKVIPKKFDGVPDDLRPCGRI